MDWDRRILVRQVFSEYLSCESMSMFLDFFSLSNPDLVIWSSLCRRLLLPIWQPGNTEIPMNEAKSLDGIISYLTQKHGGNVHEKGIVTITSMSVDDDPDYALKNVADLTSDSSFESKNAAGQWVCWDFGEMRVRPTHYTITTRLVKSWVVEGSIESENSAMIDQQTEIQDFKGKNWVSLAVSNPAEFRFIRLSETDKNHSPDNELILSPVEFFGTLSE
jgi:hypothetical protein